MQRAEVECCSWSGEIRAWSYRSLPWSFFQEKNGFGKLIFQCLPIIADIGYNKAHDLSVVVVIWSLRSLCRTKFGSQSPRPIRVFQLFPSRKPSDQSAGLYGNCILVFGSPEGFVRCVLKITRTPTVRDIRSSLRSFINFGVTTNFSSHLFVKGIILFVIDHGSYIAYIFICIILSQFKTITGRGWAKYNDLSVARG